MGTRVAFCSHRSPRALRARFAPINGISAAGATESPETANPFPDLPASYETIASSQLSASPNPRYRPAALLEESRPSARSSGPRGLYVRIATPLLLVNESTS